MTIYVAVCFLFWQKFVSSPPQLLDINKAQHFLIKPNDIPFPKNPNYIISGLEIVNGNTSKCNYIVDWSLANPELDKLPQMQNGKETEENKRRSYNNTSYHLFTFITVNVDSFNDSNITMENCHNRSSSFFFPPLLLPYNLRIAILFLGTSTDYRRTLRILSFSAVAQQAGLAALAIYLCFAVLGYR